MSTAAFLRILLRHVCAFDETAFTIIWPTKDIYVRPAPSGGVSCAPATPSNRGPWSSHLSLTAVEAFHQAARALSCLGQHKAKYLMWGRWIPSTPRARREHAKRTQRTARKCDRGATSIQYRHGELQVSLVQWCCCKKISQWGRRHRLPSRWLTVMAYPSAAAPVLIGDVDLDCPRTGCLARLSGTIPSHPSTTRGCHV